VRFSLLIVLASIVSSWSVRSLSQETDTNPSPPATALGAEQLNRTVSEYEKFLKAPPAGTPPTTLSEARTRLATAYFMQHRYHDSLEVLEPLLTASNNVPAQAWTVKGLDELELNQLSQAVPSLRHAVRENPESPTARLALGDALARSGHMQGAAQEYQRQTRLTPELADAWYKLGLAHDRLATEVADTPVRPSEETIPQQLLAEALIAKGDNLNAARMLFRVARRSPTQPDIHAGLGIALLALGYARAARDQFRQELIRNPESPNARLGMDETSVLTGDWQEAKTGFEYLARTQPLEFTRELESPPAGLVIDAWSGGRIKAPQWFLSSTVGALWQAWVTGSREVSRVTVDQPAGDTCRRGKSDASNEPGIWLTQTCYDRLEAQFRRRTRLSTSEQTKLVESEFRLEHYQAALETAEALQTADPHSGWAVYWVSKAHEALAEECFLKVGRLNPNSARVHEILAEHYSSLQDYPQAKTEYDNAVRLAPESPAAHLGLGTVLSRTGHWPEAETELKKTLELAPQSDFARYQLGHVYVEQSRWNQAIEQLKLVPKTSSALVSARLDLAQAEAESGLTAGAVQDLLSITTLDHDGEVYFRLAGLYRKLGQEAQAREALAKFKQLRASSLAADKDELGALESEQASGDSRTP
jgi:tetratricopeptide (TPR) repeat protein